MSEFDQRDVVEEAVDLLPAVARWLKQTMSGTGETAMIPVGQLRALGHLYHCGCCSVGEVATGIGVTLATASELIDRLVDAQWVERQMNPADRRQAQLRLTPRAIEVGSQIRVAQREQMTRAFDRMSELDRAAFVRGLRVLAETLDDPIDLPQSAAART